MTTDERNKPKNKRAAFRRLVDYLKPYGRSVALGVGANMGLGLIALLPPLIYGRITDQVVLGKGLDYSARVRLLIVYAI
ncbi:MAG: hypothetical protein N3B12_01570, partial [Armatimonadetes bacterium]|nr:hypothetical protein [Armatimonadota bacterium]